MLLAFFFFLRSLFYHLPSSATLTATCFFFSSHDRSWIIIHCGHSPAYLGITVCICVYQWSPFVFCECFSFFTGYPFFFLLAHLHAVKYSILSHPSSCSKLFFFFFDPSCTSFVLFRTLSLFESRSLSTAPWCNVRFFFYGVSFSFFFFVIEHVL